MSEIPARHAAVIGIDAYSHVTPLRSAVADARAIAKVLEFDHHYKAVHLLLDADATREGILRLLETLRRSLGPDSGVVIYYAGHGVTEDDASGSPQGYLLPQNARLDDKENWLSMDELRRALGLHAKAKPEDEWPCRHLLVVLDCCYAGTIRWTSTRNLGLGQPLYDSQYYRYLRGIAWQVLTSTSYSEKAVDTQPGSQNTRGPEDSAGHSALRGGAVARPRRRRRLLARPPRCRRRHDRHRAQSVHLRGAGTDGRDMAADPGTMAPEAEEHRRVPFLEPGAGDQDPPRSAAR